MWRIELSYLRCGSATFDCIRTFAKSQRTTPCARTEMRITHCLAEQQCIPTFVTPCRAISVVDTWNYGESTTSADTPLRPSPRHDRKGQQVSHGGVKGKAGHDRE